MTTSLNHAIVLHNHIIFVGSTAIVLGTHEGITEAQYRERVKVLALRPKGALLLFADEQKEVPYEKLMLWRTDTDKIDSMGYPVDVNDSVTIGYYGGTVTMQDVGSRGLIEKLNKKTAKVRLHSNYEKVINIPYSYLSK